MRKENKKERALKELADALGVPIESLRAQVAIPTEEKLLEAEAVIQFFEAAGEGFEMKQCRNCKQDFAYRHYYSGIGCCSVDCMQEDLEKRGITWNPTKPMSQRWGPYHPVVVPSSAVELLPSPSPSNHPTPQNTPAVQTHVEDTLFALDT